MEVGVPLVSPLDSQVQTKPPLLIDIMQKCTIVIIVSFQNKLKSTVTVKSKNEEGLRNDKDSS